MKNNAPRRQLHASGRRAWRALTAAALAAGLVGFLCADQTARANPGDDGVYRVQDFGNTQGPEVQASYRKAVEAAIKAGGGVVILPANIDPAFKPQSPSALFNNADEEKPPRLAPPVTVIDLRSGGSIQSPTTGITLHREFKLPENQSLPHWSYYPVLHVQNALLRGGNSYREALLADVPAGPDARFYVPTVRGLFPGLFLNANEWGEVQRLHVKTIGYDKKFNLWYFTADTNAKVAKDSYVSNKNHINSLKMDTFTHTQGATSDLAIYRENYSQGDNYLVDARFKYMGDIHSTGGDENGVIYAAFIETLTDIYRGSVERWEPQTNTLTINGGLSAASLGAGRPIINLNPSKWVSAGKARIVRPASWTEPAAVSGPQHTWEGKTYPTKPGAGSGSSPIQIGGHIRLSPDSPVTKEHIGWYFAIDVPTEWVPLEKNESQSRIRRWYQISSVEEVPGKDPFTPAGKEIRIVRHFNGVSSAGAPTLYLEDNYTWDGHDRPLNYIIAPGAIAYDVADAFTGGRSVKLAPTPFARTRADFEKSDPIEQAIGADPTRPIPFQARLNERVPAGYNFPVFDIGQNSAVGRSSVLLVRGSGGADRKPAFHTFLEFDAPAHQGIVFGPNLAGGAIVINQPNVESPILFNYGPANGRKQARVSVTPDKGMMKLEGTGVQVTGPLMALTGLSATNTPAANLRGINVKVPAGATEVAVKFDKPEADEAYAAFVETNWLTARAIVNLTKDGFTVKFEKPAEDKAVLYWIIVR